MKVLVLGSGAREHAIAWKFSQSNRIGGLYIAPGNAGTEEVGENLPDIDPADITAIRRLCVERGIDLVFVGPEKPLAEGIVDALTADGISAIGPSKSAASLESSKTFSKGFMRKHGIPTAEAVEFDDSARFRKHIEKRRGKLVIKKSGLAEGKGVLESDDKGEILNFGNHILRTDKLLVEDFLKGWEISVFAVTDGEDYLLLPVCADFKKAGESDEGANTGGMGAICPVPVVSSELMAQIKDSIIEPTFDGMKKEGLAYRGILYFGLMITDEGPKLLEYNVRLGDPETQVLLPLIKSDLVSICEAVMSGKIASFPLQTTSDAAVGVVVASAGYPGEYSKGTQVDSLPNGKERSLHIFHASTRRDEKGRIVTGGGRCFTVVGVGPTVLTANVRAYEAIPQVSFEGAWSRSDIGKKFFIES